MLVWNEYDFIECLGVLLEVENYETSHFYKVEKDGLRIELIIEQYCGDIYFELFHEGLEMSVFRMRMPNCPGVRYVRNKSEDYLEFAASKSFGKSYDGESVILYGVCLTIVPHIGIDLF